MFVFTRVIAGLKVASFVALDVVNRREDNHSMAGIV